MGIVLISDAALGHASCQRLCAQLRALQRPCFTVGMPLLGLQPLAPPTPDVTLSPMQLLGSTLLEHATAIGLFLHNPDDVGRFTCAYRALCRFSGRQAVPVFSGPLIPLVGDALIQDLSKRLSCDLLLVSGTYQLDAIHSLTFNWQGHQAPPTTIASGFWFDPQPNRETRGERMLLALIQDNIPSYPGAQAQLIRHLQGWAQQSPNWTVVLQRDHAWQQDQLSTGEAANTPTNLVAAAPEQMPYLLNRCTACLTVSSPWIFTAMAWGRASMVLADYGINGVQGTNIFFGSGAMHQLRSIRHLDDMLRLPPVNPIWLDAMGGSIRDGSQRLLQALDALATNSEHQGARP